MRRIILALALLTASSTLALAQQPEQVALPRIAKTATVNVSQLGPDYFPQMVNLEAPFPGGSSYRSWLLSRKEEIFANYQPQPGASHKTQGTAPKPTQGTNFVGNSYAQSVPNDNDCAISDDGMLVSVINTNIFMYDAPNSNNVKIVSLANFSSALGIPNSKYDPKVTYDPKADRFIMVFLNGFTETTSKIILAFSQTNDPTGNWNLYALEGNPLNDTTWTDYPIIGMTDKEFFITGNLLIPGLSWQLGFSQSIIWQIDKDNGYNGDSLNLSLWSNIKYGGRPIRNLLPIQSGSTTVGPDIYFLSNRNFDASNDSVFILHLTDTLGAPGAALNVDVKKSSTPYGMPPAAHQKFNQYLQTNDARWLGGFIENDKIQFVGNCVNPDNGLAGFYHGIIDNVSSTMDVSGTVLGDSTLDYGYPNIAYTGNSSTDNSAMIGFNHASVDTSAGFSAIYFDGTDHSERLTLKKGDNYINVLSGTAERWGDYSGCQRKYNEPGTVWVSGTWAKSNTDPGTWISEVKAPPSVGVEEEIKRSPVTVESWPNPASEFVTVEFDLEKSMDLEVALYDLQGRQVMLLWADRAKGGKNRFSFSTDPLAMGVFFLKIKGQDGMVASKKIVVQR
ncbi:MAG: T9SS type A sorting domain-containing protein [Bacteroidia bacterium]|nr:T9SS type A sorting domain-containing protein [Bacteroidia bacterium]